MTHPALQRPRSRAPVAWACAVAGALLAVAGTVIFAYQTYYSWRALIAGFDAAAQSVPDWIRWTLVDLSLVTPALVLHCGYRVLRGGIRMMRVSAMWVPDDTFPFPKRYRVFYVNMGLLGTLIGFVIAFQNPTASIQAQANVLVLSLSTAVWSSVTAVALAYGLGPLFELLCQWPFARPAPLRLSFDQLSAQASAMAAALQRATDSLTRSAKHLDLASLSAVVASLEGQGAAQQAEIAFLKADAAERELRLQAAASEQRKAIEKLQDFAKSAVSDPELAAKIAALRRDCASAEEVRRLAERVDRSEKAASQQRSSARRRVQDAVLQLRRLEASMNHGGPGTENGHGE